MKPEPDHQLPAIEQLLARVAAYTREVLGVPAELMPGQLEIDQSPLLPLSVLLRTLTTRRVRLLDRYSQACTMLSEYADNSRRIAGQDRAPWPIGADHLTVLHKLDGQIAELDDMLPALAAALVESGVAAGLVERGTPAGAVARTDLVLSLRGAARSSGDLTGRAQAFGRRMHDMGIATGAQVWRSGQLLWQTGAAPVVQEENR